MAWVEGLLLDVAYNCVLPSLYKTQAFAEPLGFRNPRTFVTRFSISGTFEVTIRRYFPFYASCYRELCLRLRDLVSVRNRFQ
jgi:hypothetical protein